MTTTRLAPVILAAALWLVLGQVALAQEQPRQREQQHRYRPDRYDPDQKACDRPARRHELRRIFHPAPEDFGPIRPGEHEELREFARVKMPRMYRVLERLENRRPRAFRKNLHRLLPQLRHLQRLHKHNPEMAQLVGRHAENLFHARMLGRAWEHATDERAHIEQQLRRRVADNITVRTDALLLWADQLEAARETQLAERLTLLTREDVDLAEEAPEVREQVRVFWSLDSEARRREARDNLATSLATQLDREIAGMRKRARAMKSAAEQDVDRRVRQILEGRRPRRPRP